MVKDYIKSIGNEELRDDEELLARPKYRSHERMGKEIGNGVRKVVICYEYDDYSEEEESSEELLIEKSHNVDIDHRSNFSVLKATLSRNYPIIFNHANP